jgi:hypothetical protein
MQVDIPASGQSSSWATYTFNRTLAPGTTSIMIVPVAGAGSRLVTTTLAWWPTNSSTPLTVSITSPANSAVVTSNYTINATATVSPGTVTNVAFYDGVSAARQRSEFTIQFECDRRWCQVRTHLLPWLDPAVGNSATSAVVNVIGEQHAGPGGLATGLGR